MKWLFWISVLAIAYAYVGYPLWLWLRSVLFPRPVAKASIFPFVSIVMAVRNEAAILRDKLESLSALSYPASLLEIIIVSDGSTDETSQVLEAQKRDSVVAIASAQHEGKACVLNRGVKVARGEIIVFTDARQTIEPQALRQLITNFADPTVGCASGELMLGGAGGSEVSDGVGLYWRFEKKIREWESATKCVVGATGAFYAVRKELVASLPHGTILDDVFIPLNVARRGYRVIFDPKARAWDPLPTTVKREFQRKTRTLTGNYQLLQLAPWLLTKANPVRFEFVSHKLMRLVVPFALAAALLSSLFATGEFYRLALAVQIAFYGLGALAFLRLKMGVLSRFANLASSFLLLNAAATLALFNLIAGRKHIWVR